MRAYRKLPSLVSFLSPPSLLLRFLSFAFFFLSYATFVPFRIILSIRSSILSFPMALNQLIMLGYDPNMLETRKQCREQA
jgi:hypothetical protein